MLELVKLTLLKFVTWKKIPDNSLIYIFEFFNFKNAYYVMLKNISCYEFCKFICKFINVKEEFAR